SRVVEKYFQFLQQFPTVEMLAKAKSANVLIAWQGLGYNRRALYLQRTAQVVVSEYGGTFPKNIALLKQLPGIGDYTARAILSFAFLKKTPMIDTNHRKWYLRVFGTHMTDSQLLEEANSLLEGYTGRDIYQWNQ